MTTNLRCTRCGLPEEEHAYDRCAWGICAGFLAASRDAAEGAHPSLLADEIERSSGLYCMGPDGHQLGIRKTSQIITALRPAPPKPAPDAMREALKPFADIAQFIVEAQRDTRPLIFGVDTVIAQRLTIGHLRNARAAYLSAPVPPADGAGWPPSNANLATALRDLENKVEPCWFLIVAEAARRLSPSPAVAAKPETADEIGRAIQNLRHVKTTMQNDDLSEPRSEKRARLIFRQETLADIEELLLRLAAPPVRGDREAFYSILSHYIPQQSIDQAWQELREAGLAP